MYWEVKMKLFQPEDGWRTFPRPKSNADTDFFPNRMWHNERTGEGVLAAYQSDRYTKFAIGEKGLNYLLTALKEERITTGDVVTVNLNDELIARKSVSEVVASVKNIPPKNGPYGRYWLFNADLTPYDESKVPF
jgi:hypothetical protein